MATWVLGSDVARDELAKRRSEGTKTASRRKESWKGVARVKREASRECGGRMGAREGSRASGQVKSGVLRSSERRAHNLLAAVGLKQHTVA